MIYNPTSLFITLHTTGGDSFAVAAAHIIWIEHLGTPTNNHVLYVNDGAGAPTTFTISHTHWLELTTASPHVVFLPDQSP